MRKLHLLVVLMALFYGANAQNRHFVKPDATGSGDSWADPADLQTMIDAAPSGDSIFVAGGTYLAPLNGSFQMKAGVKIYGSFVGTEAYLKLRDPALLDTSILKGNGSSVIDNASLVMDSTAILDGFKVTNGRLNGRTGAGMRLRKAAPLISNCSFEGNQVTGSGYDGGGIWIYTGSPIIRHCLFARNTTDFVGGAISIFSGSPTIEDCAFYENSGGSGGAINSGYSANTYISNSVFKGNVSANSGGAIVIYGNGLILNCLIAGNVAQNGSGGAIMVNGSSHLQITNSTIAGNKDAPAYHSGGIWNASAASVGVAFTNCIIWGNSGSLVNYANATSTYKYSLVEGMTLPAGEGNIEDGTDPGNNPQFVLPVDYSLTPFVGGDYHVLGASITVDAGTPDTTGLGLPPMDLAGNSRVEGAGIDLGAYEQSFPSNVITNNGVDTYAGFNGVLALSGTKVLSDLRPLYYRWQIKVVANTTPTDTTVLDLDPADYYNTGIQTNMHALGIVIDSITFGVANLSILPPALALLGIDLPSDPASFNGKIVFTRLVGNDDAGTYSTSNRLIINIDPSALPVQVKSFTGMIEGGFATLNWASGVEQNLDHYVLDRSTDGLHFTKVDEISPKGSGHSYSYRTPQQDLRSYYRLSWVETNGNAFYHNHLVILNLNATKAGLSIYPNPAENFVFVQAPEKGSFRLFNSGGKVVIELTVEPGLNRVDIQNLPAGVYFGTLNKEKFKLLKK